MDKITEAEYIILERMNEGMYLIKKIKQEALSRDGGNTDVIIKSGTIQRFLDMELIRRSIRKNKIYILTNEGRKYKRYVPE